MEPLKLKMGGDMNDLDRAEHKREVEADRREELVNGYIDDINSCDSECIFKTKSSVLHNVWTLYHDSPEIKDRLHKAVVDLIKGEAEERYENKFSGGE
jgi:hypothetical protein